jgi:hypothetical protein
MLNCLRNWKVSHAGERKLNRVAHKLAYKALFLTDKLLHIDQEASHYILDILHYKKKNLFFTDYSLVTCEKKNTL